LGGCRLMPAQRKGPEELRERAVGALRPPRPRADRVCGACGRLRPVARRVAGSNPDLCADCAPSLDGTCVACARLRPGHLSRTGSFYCDSGRRRAERTCAIGQRVRSVQANWPAGPAYASCYARVRDQPSPCAGCAKVRALIGVDSAGQGGMRPLLRRLDRLPAICPRRCWPTCSA